MRVPTENAVAIGDIDERDADKWTTMGLLLIPYDGLLSVDLKAGETVVVSGRPAISAARRSRWL